MEERRFQDLKLILLPYANIHVGEMMGGTGILQDIVVRVSSGKTSDAGRAPSLLLYQPSKRS